VTPPVLLLALLALPFAGCGPRPEVLRAAAVAAAAAGDTDRAVAWAERAERQGAPFPLALRAHLLLGAGRLEETPYARLARLDAGSWFDPAFSGERLLLVSQAVRLIPADRLLLETDCPYLAPVPYRGRRNEPAYLVTTAATVAAERDDSGVVIGQLARRNAIRLFALPDLPPGNTP